MDPTEATHYELPPTLLPGLLHTYNTEARLTAFESGDYEAPCTVIFIGGLGDSFSATPYIHPLSQALQKKEWSLTQVQLSSSGAGFGAGSVAQDAKELRQLIDYLRGLGKSSFVLLGHSTGCQDIVKLFLQIEPKEAKRLGIKGVILQAPVSDREYAAETLGKEKYDASLKAARALVAKGEEEEPVPSEYSDLFTGGRSTITAGRWLSLASSLVIYEQGEDYFSSDHHMPLLRRHLGRIGDSHVPAIILFSSKDASMATSVDKNKLLKRFLEALEGTEVDSLSEKFKELVGTTKEEGREKLSEKWSGVLAGAGHSIEEEGPMAEFIEHVLGFVGEV